MTDTRANNKIAPAAAVGTRAFHRIDAAVRRNGNLCEELVVFSRNKRDVLISEFYGEDSSI